MPNNFTVLLHTGTSPEVLCMLLTWRFAILVIILLKKQKRNKQNEEERRI